MVFRGMLVMDFRIPAAETREKILYEKRDVFAAIVKGWHFDGKDFEPIEEVLAKRSFVNHFVQFAMRSRESPARSWGRP
jgi:hypothetical protein